MALFGLAVFMVAFYACGGGGGKYADLKPVIKDMNKATEKFIADMEKADNGEKVAAALTGYAEAMGKLQPKMKEMEEKYPELKDMTGPPPELGADAEKLMELMGKMTTSMMKAMEYADDPAVQKAQEELDKAMSMK